MEKTKKEKLDRIRGGLSELVLDHGQDMPETEILTLLVIDRWLDDMVVPDREELH